MASRDWNETSKAAQSRSSAGDGVSEGESLAVTSASVRLAQGDCPTRKGGAGRSARIFQLEDHPRFRLGDVPPEGDIHEDYRLLLVGQGKTPDTIRTYTQHFRRYLRWCKAHDLDPFYISQREVMQHIADMTGRGLSRSSINTRIATLKSFHRWITTEQGTQDPTAQLVSRKETVEPREPFTPEEIGKLYDSCETDLERAVLLMLTGGGVRRSELLAIQITDLDWEGRILIHGKGRKQRHISPGPQTLQAIKRLVGDRATGPVFECLKGNKSHHRRKRGPLSKSGLDRLLKSIAKRAGVANVYCHRFRITSICEQLAAGGDTIAVATMHGHSPAMTEHYQRASAAGRALELQQANSLPERMSGAISRTVELEEYEAAVVESLGSGAR